MKYNSLIDNGFIHLKNVISKEDIEKLVYEYQNSDEISNKKYNLKKVTPVSREILKPYYLKIMAEITDLTHLTLNTLVENGGSYFSTTNGTYFDWHQDSITYYLYQTHLNFIIIWAPIIKPAPELGNLSLAPYQRLSKVNEKFFNSRIDKGSASFYRTKNKNFVYLTDTNNDQVINVDFNLNELQYTPELVVGDVLIMRGDLFHKSQENCHDRVAISLYGLNHDTQITRNHFESSGEYKNKYFEKNPELYSILADFFKLNETAKIKDLLKFINAHSK
jgi:ectoine hydroxylase-related dioxygenase (phytanoyl-CoA dioxygenase family)